MADTPQNASGEPPSSNLTGSTSSGGGNVGDAKVGIKVDSQAITATANAIRSLTSEAKKMADEFERAAKASANIGAGAAPNGNKNAKYTNTSPPASASASPSAATAAATKGGGGFMGKVGGIGKLAAMGSLFGGGATFASGLMSGAGARMDRGMDYALAGSKLDMVSMQIYGLSEKQAMAQRTSLAGSKLGTGGSAALMSYQFTSGTSAQGMAPQVEGLRAMSGYSKSTADVLNMQRAFTSPQTVNRAMMFGQRTYDGDTVKGPYDQIKSYASTVNVAAGDWSGALRQGSNTRAMLQMRGAPEAAIDDILTQARAQQQFTKAGGDGTYDASNVDHMKKIGTDDTLIQKFEELEQIREKREAEYNKNNINGFKDKMDIDKAILNTLMSIEKFVAPVTNFQNKTRGVLGAAGSLMTAAGGIALLMPEPVISKGIAAGLLAGGIGASALAGGDPPESGGGGKGTAPVGVSNDSSRDNHIKIPVGYGGGKKTLNEVKERADFKTMHPKMQQRMLSMFRENPNLGIGGGSRKSSDQEAMFRSRYRKTGNSDGDVFWEGAWWDRHSGAPAAPPGRSMHEIGLAADLVGDLDWLQSNASRFGLKTFADVNNEPWHIQPIELANSRRKYEEGGSPWGTDGDYEADAVFTDRSGQYGPGGDNTDVSGHQHDGGHAGGGAGGSLNGLTTNEVMDLVAASGTALLGSGAGFGGGKAPVGNTSQSTTTVAPFDGVPKKGAMEAAKAAYAAGFRGKNLSMITAIAGRESNWDSSVLNPNGQDTGMWQINAKAHAKTISRLGGTQNNLYDVNFNAQVARDIWMQGGSDPWHPWKGSDKSMEWGPPARPGWDRNGDHKWKTEGRIGEATAAANAVSAQGGDPVDIPSPRKHGGGGKTAGGGSMNISNAPVINFSPNVVISSSGGTNDLRNVSDELVGMIKQKLATLEMRTA